MSEIVKKYNEEFKEDCFVDSITLMDKLQTMSAISEKWALRVYQHSDRLAKLKNRRDEVFAEVRIALEQNNDPRLKSKSESMIDQIVSKEKPILVINKKMDDELLVLNYVEELLNNCKFTLSKKLDTIVELKKLEALS